MDSDLKKLGEKIKDLRIKNGLTKERLILEADLSKYYYYRVENGEANPSVLHLRKIAKVLKVRVKDLIDF